jgi:hypothetical protein
MRTFAVIAAIASSCLIACSLSHLPFLSSNSSSKSSESHTVATSETHTVNGHPVDRNGNREDVASEDDDDRGSRGGKGRHSGGGEFGATCRHNDDCASNSCYVGSGELGYCTKICSGNLDCPMSYACTHKGVGNAPQKICQQDGE